MPPQDQPKEHRGFTNSDAEALSGLREKAAAIAKRMQGTFSRTSWDPSFTGTAEDRPLWFRCKYRHEFLASVWQVEQHEKRGSEMSWCPNCVEQDRYKAGLASSKGDPSWEEFFERTNHVGFEKSFMQTEKGRARDQAKLFEQAREAVTNGEEWQDDLNFFSDPDEEKKEKDKPASEPGASKHAGGKNFEAEPKLRGPEGEVARVMAVLKAKGGAPVPSLPLGDLCLVLGLSQRIAADPERLRRHYRKLVLCLHPDKNPFENAKDAFTAVQQAMEQVSVILAKAGPRGSEKPRERPKD